MRERVNGKMCIYLENSSNQISYLCFIDHISNELSIVCFIARPCESFNIHPNHTNVGTECSNFFDCRLNLK